MSQIRKGTLLEQDQQKLTELVSSSYLRRNNQKSYAYY